MPVNTLASRGLRYRRHLLLRACPGPLKSRFSAASTVALPASSRFGFLRAEMASWSSASTSAFFRARSSSTLLLLPLRLAASELLRDNMFVGRSFSDEMDDDRRGMLANGAGSLISRFSPGIGAAVALRICAIASLGPRETLRRSRSLDSTRSRLRTECADADVRRVTAPGLANRCCCCCCFDDDLSRTLSVGDLVEPDAALDDREPCGAITGPPSLRLSESQIKGRRGEKLHFLSVVVRLHPTRIARKLTKAQ